MGLTFPWGFPGLTQLLVLPPVHPDHHPIHSFILPVIRSQHLWGAFVVPGSARRPGGAAVSETDPPLCSWARVLWGTLGCQSTGCCDGVGKVLSRWGAQPGLSTGGLGAGGEGAVHKGPPARGAECAKVLGQEPAVRGRAAGAECDWPKPGTGRKWGPCRPESRQRTLGHPCPAAPQGQCQRLT